MIVYRRLCLRHTLNTARPPLPRVPHRALHRPDFRVTFLLYKSVRAGTGMKRGGCVGGRPTADCVRFQRATARRRAHCISRKAGRRDAVRGKHSPTGEKGKLGSVWQPAEEMVPPGRTRSYAARSADGEPTTSSTASAPRPPVAALPGS